MKGAKILWVDDEVDLLRVHILFLEAKGHNVTTCNNGYDAIEIVAEENFDIIFLDENMPGMSGLDVLPEIKQIKPNTPVVMITKNEEEDIMDEAIGSNINDYLLKPVNPKQILLTIKKNVDNKRLIQVKTASNYQNEFRKITNLINESTTYDDWINIYKKLVYWENKLNNSEKNTMEEVIKMQKEAANSSFCKFIKSEYIGWFNENNEDRPKLPIDFFRKKIIPLMDKGEKVFVIVIDNLRFDHWQTIRPLIENFMDVKEEEIWYSILPTATQYARNAFFAGLMPLDISERYPNFWLNDDEEGGKNMHEEKLLDEFFKRYRRKVKFNYRKVLDNKFGKKVVDSFSDLIQKQLSVIVYNFIDVLSHARTEMKMIRELANNEQAYRSLALTWFEHSPLLDLFKKLAKHKIKTFITTDHGTVQVENPVKVIGDRNTTTNLRYKQGRNLKYKRNQVFAVRKPQKIGLPVSNISSSYIFTYNRDFFAYPNNFNHYVRYYKDTFQHGGISLEEMLIPVISLVPKS